MKKMYIYIFSYRPFFFSLFNSLLKDSLRCPCHLFGQGFFSLYQRPPFNFFLRENKIQALLVVRFKLVITEAANTKSGSVHFYADVKPNVRQAADVDQIPR